MFPRNTKYKRLSDYPCKKVKLVQVGDIEELLRLFLRLNDDELVKCILLENIFHGLFDRFKRDSQLKQVLCFLFTLTDLQKKNPFRKMIFFEALENHLRSPNEFLKSMYASNPNQSKWTDLTKSKVKVKNESADKKSSSNHFIEINTISNDSRLFPSNTQENFQTGVSSKSSIFESQTLLVNSKMNLQVDFSNFKNLLLIFQNSFETILLCLPKSKKIANPREPVDSAKVQLKFYLCKNKIGQIDKNLQDVFSCQFNDNTLFDFQTFYNSQSLVPIENERMSN